jgi:hypothetical protein
MKRLGTSGAGDRTWIEAPRCDPHQPSGGRGSVLTAAKHGSKVCAV